MQKMLAQQCAIVLYNHLTTNSRKAIYDNEFLSDLEVFAPETPDKNCIDLMSFSNSYSKKSKPKPEKLNVEMIRKCINY